MAGLGGVFPNKFSDTYKLADMKISAGSAVRWKSDFFPKSFTEVYIIEFVMEKLG